MEAAEHMSCTCIWRWSEGASHCMKIDVKFDYLFLLLRFCFFAIYRGCCWFFFLFSVLFSYSMSMKWKASPFFLDPFICIDLNWYRIVSYRVLEHIFRWLEHATSKRFLFIYHFVIVCLLRSYRTLLIAVRCSIYNWFWLFMGHSFSIGTQHTQNHNLNTGTSVSINRWEKKQQHTFVCTITKIKPHKKDFRHRFRVSIAFVFFFFVLTDASTSVDGVALTLVLNL